MRSRPQTSSPNKLEISAFRCNRVSGHYAMRHHAVTGERSSDYTAPMQEIVEEEESKDDRAE